MTPDRLADARRARDAARRQLVVRDERSMRLLELGLALTAITAVVLLALVRA